MPGTRSGETDPHREAAGPAPESAGPNHVRRAHGVGAAGFNMPRRSTEEGSNRGCQGVLGGGHDDQEPANPAPSHVGRTTRRVCVELA